MRILIDNEIENATLTATGTSSSFPLENLYEGALTERAEFDNYVVIDLGSAKSINTVAYANNLYGITIEANASDVWTSPSFSEVLTKEVTFISQTYRYWRINTSQIDTRLGYFYLGNYLQLSDTTGKHEEMHNKTDIKKPTSSSVIYPTNGIMFKSEKAEFPLLDLSERTSFLSWWDSLDSAKNHFLVRFEDNLSDFPPYYCSILSMEMGRDFQNYDLTLNIQESK